MTFAGHQMKEENGGNMLKQIKDVANTSKTSTGRIV